MRWLTFLLLAMVTLCAQTTVAHAIAIRGIVPDFLFVLVVHYALHARTPDAVLSGWLLGLFTDLASVQQLGIVALVYGLLGFAIWSIRDVVFIKHPLTHFFVTLCACLIAQLMLRGYDRMTYGGSTALVGVGLASGLTALYTALWAVVIHRLLLAISPALGLGGRRRGDGGEPTRRTTRVV